MNKVELYYHYALSRLEEQEERFRDLERKAAVLLTLASILIAAGAISIKDFSVGSRVALSDATLFSAAVLGVLFLLTLFYILESLWPRSWQRDPGLPDVGKHVRDEDVRDEIMTRWAGDQIRNAAAVNEDTLLKKAKSVRWAMIVLFLMYPALGVVAVVAHQ